jgi:integrase
LFRRTRYQQGSLRLEERKRGPAVWVYRWWENDITGKPIRRKVQLGCLERYPNESAACAAADALRLTINNQSKRKNLQKTTVNTLWEHYCREELPLKEISTQDAYLVYAKKWILPRWGNLLLEDIKTIEVERWLRAAEVADGTKAKIKCVMSAVFSHAVRWGSVATIPFHREYQLERGGREGQARACASVRSVRSLP